MEKRDWGLGGGDFFDGYFFRDITGQILSGHPKRQQLLEEYLKVENEKIAEENNLKKEREKYRRKFYSNL